MNPDLIEQPDDAGVDVKKYIPINKGHFSLEPPERINAFNAILADGWEEEYYEYRRLWNELPVRKEIRDYPLLVDLELASRCNLKCPMCPTITEEFIEKRVKPYRRGLLDFDLAKKIIDEVAGKVYALRLSWVGEPTLHPKFVEIVQYAKDHGIHEVSFLTNGYRMRRDFFTRVAQAGADWITISIDGMGETYNKIRAPLKFDETLQKIREMKEYKDKNGLKKPVIKIQGVWPAVRESAELFYNTFAPYVDMIAFNPLIDYLHKDTDIVYEDGFSCPQYYQRLVVSSNGKVAMCSNDDNVEVVIGDANEQSVHQIWHGEKMNELRAIHSVDGGFKNIISCRRCYYPRKAAPDEITVINGRTIHIENYVNRSQVIGQ
ncbi:MAG: radical SAM protein [bacterium]|nr:radical SAM protein [bacterium]